MIHVCVGFMSRFDSRSSMVFQWLLDVIPSFVSPLCCFLPHYIRQNEGDGFLDQSVTSSFSSLICLYRLRLKLLFFDSRRLQVLQRFLGAAVDRHGVALGLCSHPIASRVPYYVVVQFNFYMQVQRLNIRKWRCFNMFIALFNVAMVSVQFGPMLLL